jgi:hypothetical protein
MKRWNHEQDWIIAGIVGYVLWRLRPAFILAAIIGAFWLISHLKWV